MARKYDREFKLEAIRLATEDGAQATDIERRLGLSQGMISRWKRQLYSEGVDAFPGKGHVSANEEQVRHLQRENERLRRERDSLKKALAILSVVRVSIEKTSFSSTARCGVLRRCAVCWRCLAADFMPGKIARPVGISKKPDDWIKRLSASIRPVAVDRVVPKSRGRCGWKTGTSVSIESLNG